MAASTHAAPSDARSLAEVTASAAADALRKRLQADASPYALRACAYLRVCASARLRASARLAADCPMYAMKYDMDGDGYISPSEWANFTCVGCTCERYDPCVHGAIQGRGGGAVSLHAGLQRAVESKWRCWLSSVWHLMASRPAAWSVDASSYSPSR